jgi:hypothetical protein
MSWRDVLTSPSGLKSKLRKKPANKKQAATRAKPYAGNQDLIQARSFLLLCLLSASCLAYFSTLKMEAVHCFEVQCIYAGLHGG